MERVEAVRQTEELNRVEFLPVRHLRLILEYQVKAKVYLQTPQAKLVLYSHITKLHREATSVYLLNKISKFLSITLARLTLET